MATLLLAVCTLGSELVQKSHDSDGLHQEHGGTQALAERDFEPIIGALPFDGIQAYISVVEDERQKALHALHTTHNSIQEEGWRFSCPSALVGLVPEEYAGTCANMATDIGALTALYWDLKTKYNKAANLHEGFKQLSAGGIDSVNGFTAIDATSTPFEALALEAMIHKAIHKIEALALQMTPNSNASPALLDAILECDLELTEEEPTITEKSAAAKAAEVTRDKALYSAAEQAVQQEAEDEAEKLVECQATARGAEAGTRIVPIVGQGVGAAASYGLMKLSVYEINHEFLTTYTEFINNFYGLWIRNIYAAEIRLRLPGYRQIERQERERAEQARQKEIQHAHLRREEIKSREAMQTALWNSWN